MLNLISKLRKICWNPVNLNINLVQNLNIRLKRLCQIWTNLPHKSYPFLQNLCQNSSQNCIWMKLSSPPLRQLRRVVRSRASPKVPIEQLLIFLLTFQESLFHRFPHFLLTFQEFLSELLIFCPTQFSISKLFYLTEFPFFHKVFYLKNNYLSELLSRASFPSLCPSLYFFLLFLFPWYF